MAYSTLLGPEGTTRVVVFQSLEMPLCGLCSGGRKAPGAAWSRIPPAVVGFGVGLVGCGLVVC